MNMHSLVRVCDIDDAYESFWLASLMYSDCFTDTDRYEKREERPPPPPPQKKMFTSRSPRPPKYSPKYALSASVFFLVRVGGRAPR